jgi:FAD dependent oxidoreductase
MSVVSSASPVSNPKKPTVLVLGDELESVLLASGLARRGCSVQLWRRSLGCLGGLSTRGGLAYMDLTPELLTPRLATLLQSCGLKRVALDANRAHQALQTLLLESGVTVCSGIQATLPLWDWQGELVAVQAQYLHRHESLEVDFVVDSEPDLAFTRACGVPYRRGMGEVFGPNPDWNTLGMSPVFQVHGLTRESLIALERTLREDAKTAELLAQIFPFYSSGYQAELKERPCYSPEDLDYIDMLNPTFGACYHQWRYGSDLPFAEAPFWIDGGNIARLGESTLSWNGLVTRLTPEECGVALSQERVPLPPRVLEELKALERFLQEKTQRTSVWIEAPEALYIRQTLNVQAERVLDAATVFRGGVSEAEAIGTYSYWLDFRGVHPWEAYPPFHPLVKPLFRVGLASNVASRWHPAAKKLAFLGRSAGYSPLAQGACRIVQHNALIAEALSVAIPKALTEACRLLDVPACWIREQLAQEAQDLCIPYDSNPSAQVAYPPEHPLWEWDVLKRDTQLAAQLQSCQDAFSVL